MGRSLTNHSPLFTTSSFATRGLQWRSAILARFCITIASRRVEHGEPEFPNCIEDIFGGCCVVLLPCAEDRSQGQVVAAASLSKLATVS